MDPSARIAIPESGSGPEPESPPSVEDIVGDFDTQVAIRALRSAEATATSLRGLSPLSALLTHPVSALDPAGVGLSLTVDGEDVRSLVRHRLFFDSQTFSTYMVYRGDPECLAVGPLADPSGRGHSWGSRLLTGARLAVARYARDSATGKVELSVPMTGRPVLVDFNEGAANTVRRAFRSVGTTAVVNRRNHRPAPAGAVGAGCRCPSLLRFSPHASGTFARRSPTLGMT